MLILLRVLRTRLTVLEVVAGLEAALYFCREGCRMLFCSKGAVHISVDSDDPVRSRHLVLGICIMWHCIESCQCGSSEQCVVAATEGDDIED